MAAQAEMVVVARSPWLGSARAEIVVVDYRG